MGVGWPLPFNLREFSFHSAGVVGRSASSVSGDKTTGVMGVSGLNTPVPRADTGVYGVANAAAGVGVAGTPTLGRGGQFASKQAQLRLVPSNAASHPSAGAKGDLFVDASGRLWFYTERPGSASSSCEAASALGDLLPVAAALAEPEPRVLVDVEISEDPGCGMRRMGRGQQA